MRPPTFVVRVREGRRVGINAADHGAIVVVRDAAAACQVCGKRYSLRLDVRLEEVGA